MTNWKRTLGSTLLFIVIFILAQFLASTSVLLFGRVCGVVISEDIFFISSYLISAVITLLTVTLWERRRYHTATHIDSSMRGFDPTALLMGVVLLVALSIVIMPLSSILPPDDRHFPDGGWTLLAVVFLAPLFEELIFRGRLYGLLLHNTTPARAALLSSLAFAVVHLEPIVMIEAFFAGLVFSYIYIKRRSIIAAILLHMCNNAMAYTILTLRYQGKTLVEFVDNRLVLFVIYGVALVVVIIGFINIARTLHRESRRATIETFENSDITE